jgi:hypothetical protein
VAVVLPRDRDAPLAVVHQLALARVQPPVESMNNAFWFMHDISDLAGERMYNVDRARVKVSRRRSATSQ